MKKVIPFALYFFLLFVTTSAFSTGTSSADNTYEVCQIESTEEAHTSLTELMRWCNARENSDLTQTESGVYQLQDDTVLSVNPNASCFLCTQDQIDHNDLLPQDVTLSQNQTLYLVIKEEASAERSSDGGAAPKQKITSSFDSYPSIQAQIDEQKSSAPSRFQQFLQHLYNIFKAITLNLLFPILSCLGMQIIEQCSNYVCGWFFVFIGV